MAHGKMLIKNEQDFKWYKAVRTNPPKTNMSTQLKNSSFDDSLFLQHLPQMYKNILENFRKIVQSFILFHVVFIVLIAVELMIVLPLSVQSMATFALALGAIFLSAFSYVVLCFYFYTRKPERLFDLKETFLQSCRRHLSIPSGELQHHLSISAALMKLAAYLEDFEKSFYKLPSFLQPIEPFLATISSYFYWKDVFKLKQFLLDAAIEEHLMQIRITPTDLEVHASLATTYVAQSKLFRNIAALNHRKSQAMFEASFRASARLAMEEFRILNHYAPNDPWVHEQLATGYHELDMPEEELREMEFLFTLRPQDREILFRLGELYFQQKMNAKGLQIYEELKQSNFKKAESLIASYGRAS